MSLHQKNKDKLPDSCFDAGTLAHIVPGNKGRLLDGRRTPGFVEGYDAASAMFVWRITDFEDRGRCWQIPAENIVSYQFAKNSAQLTEPEVEAIKNQCDLFAEKVVINSSEADLLNTFSMINTEKIEARNWFLKQSQFVNCGDSQLDMQAKLGSELLFNDLRAYMSMREVLDLEQKTAKQFVLNPHSGEWIKGLRLVMAEMGLLDFAEKRPRTDDIFKGIGSKENRAKYIIARLAFVQTFFELAACNKVQLFRGMVTEGANYETPKTLVSASFNPEVGKAFACIERNDKQTFSYVVKFTYPIENLFMTFFETETFNERYQEQEAVILYRDRLVF